MPSYTTNYNLIKPNVNDPVDEDLWGGYLNDDLDDIDTNLKAVSDVAGVPIGTLIIWPTNTPPTGYLLCYGQTVSRTTYANLFAVLGTTYGDGDGTTTFGLPDARGRAIAGKDNMGGVSADRLTGLSGGIDGDTLGATGGLESHTLTTAQIPSHTHSVNGYTLGNTGAGYQSDRVAAANEVGTGSNLTFTSGSTGSDVAHNNVQPTIIMNICIRYA